MEHKKKKLFSSQFQNVIFHVEYTAVTKYIMVFMWINVFLAGVLHKLTYTSSVKCSHLWVAGQQTNEQLEYSISHRKVVCSLIRTKTGKGISKLSAE